MMILELEIFYLTQEQLALEETGVPVPFSDMDVKKITLYEVSYVTTRKDEPNYSIICSGGVELTCNESKEVVNQKIKDARIFKFN
jgi:hypothetical protein